MHTKLTQRQFSWSLNEEIQIGPCKNGDKISFMGKKIRCSVVRTEQTIPRNMRYFYFETRVISTGNGTIIGIGLTPETSDFPEYPHDHIDTMGLALNTHETIVGGIRSFVFREDIKNDDIVGCQFMRTHVLEDTYDVCLFSLNGRQVGPPLTSLTKELYPSVWIGSPGASVICNLGKDKFVYEPIVENKGYMSADPLSKVNIVPATTQNTRETSCSFPNLGVNLIIRGSERLEPHLVKEYSMKSTDNEKSTINITAIVSASANIHNTSTSKVDDADNIFTDIQPSENPHNETIFESQTLQKEDINSNKSRNSKSLLNTANSKCNNVKNLDLNYITKTSKIDPKTYFNSKTYYFYKCKLCKYIASKNSVRRHVLQMWKNKDSAHSVETSTCNTKKNPESMAYAREGPMHEGKPSIVQIDNTSIDKTYSKGINVQEETVETKAGVDSESEMCSECFRYNIVIGSTFYKSVVGSYRLLCQGCHMKGLHSGLEFQKNIFNGKKPSKPEKLRYCYVTSLQQNKFNTSKQLSKPSGHTTASAEHVTSFKTSVSYPVTNISTIPYKKQRQKIKILETSPKGARKNIKGDKSCNVINVWKFKYICGYATCAKSFPSLSGYKRHLASTHIRINLLDEIEKIVIDGQCSFCGKRQPKAFSFIQHVGVYHNYILKFVPKRIYKQLV